MWLAGLAAHIGACYTSTASIDKAQTLAGIIDKMQTFFNDYRVFVSHRVPHFRVARVPHFPWRTVSHAFVSHVCHASRRTVSHIPHFHIAACPTRWHRSVSQIFLSHRVPHFPCRTVCHMFASHVSHTFASHVAHVFLSLMSHIFASHRVPHFRIAQYSTFSRRKCLTISSTQLPLLKHAESANSSTSPPHFSRLLRT